MKNSKYFMLAMLGLMAVPALAQETYQDTKLTENSLNGTARYVGMGGAMEALGADISTIGTNPAGIGLFRKNQVSISAGVVAQTDAENHTSYNATTIDFKGDKSHVSFDQLGIVWSPTRGRSSYLNLAFNYHKSADFGQILNAANSLGGASQSKLTAMKYAQFYGKQGSEMVWTGVDANYDVMMNKSDDNQMAYYNGKEFLFGQYQHGYIGEYDFNISGSLNNRVWLGLTVGIHDVNYRSNSYYAENLVPGDGQSEEPESDQWEDLRINGTGFDVKLGVIFRPVKDSPFRIGAYINSPVYYDLTMRGETNLQLYDESINSKPLTPSDVDPNYKPPVSDYDYRLNTPWKAGVSLGHTVGNFLALGGTYEYAWYDHMDNRVKDGGYYDSWYGDYYETSSSDDGMNDNTRYSLKGVSTVKLGLEYKPISMLALRLGYNYVSPMFRNRGYRDQSIASPGTAYATSSDYTNWKATNRITAGIGFNYQGWGFDVAYQYSAQKGDFYPFMSYYDNEDSANDCVAPVTEVKNNRHQLLMTLSYKF